MRTAAPLLCWPVCKGHGAVAARTFLAASFDSCSLLAPVHTIFPEPKISAVVFGSRMRMITAAKRCRRGPGRAGGCERVARGPPKLGYT